MSDKLEMPLEKFAEAVAKENERLQSQYDIAIGAIRVGVERIEQLTSGPGGIMEMKQTIADKEQRIEKLENQFKLYFHAFNKAASHIEKLETALEHTTECFLGAREALKECVIERDEARKALERNPEKSVYKEGYRAVEEAMGHPSPEFWVERKYD